MDIRVERGDIAQQSADMIIVNLFEGVTSPGGGTGAVDAALDGAISQVINDGGCRGKPNEMTMIHTLGKLPSPRVLVAGLGKQDEFTLDKIRALAAAAARYARRSRCERIAPITHDPPEPLVQQPLLEQRGNWRPSVQQLLVLLIMDRMPQADPHRQQFCLASHSIDQ